MAIILPARGSGGTDRAPRFRAPTAANVPIVRQAADPGLRVPAPVDTGIAALGQGVTDLGTGLQAKQVRLAAAEQRLNNRRNSVERMRSGGDLEKFSSDTFTEFESDRDFSKNEDADEFGALIRNKSQELLSAHKESGASEEDMLRMQERLLGIEQSWTAKAGTASVTAQDALIAAEHEKIINSTVAEVHAGMDPVQVIKDAQARFDTERHSARPEEEIAFTKALKARVWLGKVQNLVAKGSLDAAEDVLENPTAQAAIGAKNQQAAFNRIEIARREKREGKTRTWTDSEVAARGMPPGTIVQQNEKGDLRVVFKPTTDETQRAKEIEAVTAQKVAQGLNEAAANEFATNLADGNVSIEINPTTGRATLTDHVKQTVEEIEIGQAGTPPPEVPTVSLRELALTGDIAGVVPAFKEFSGETFGQIPAVPVDEELIDARQQFRSAERALKRSEALSSRFPVTEMKQIAKDIKISPELFDSQRSLLARMAGVDKTMRVRLQNERRAQNDTTLPDKIRGEAARAANDIENFLNILDMEGFSFDELDLPPEGIPEGSTKATTADGTPLETESGQQVWFDPDGIPWVGGN